MGYRVRGIQCPSWVTVNVYVAVGDVVFVVVVFAVFVGFVVFVVVVVVVFVGGVVLQLWLQGVGGQEWTEYWMRERARAAKASKQASGHTHSITLTLNHASLF
jgi:hypothetical protein